MSELAVKSDLAGFRKNINSQFGEDGIIEEILGRIGRGHALDRWCVEFGAWDGLHLSNTCNLIRNQGYKAVLIEGNAERHRDLCRNFPSEDVVKVCRFVTFDGDSTLDGILGETPIPKDFDFLSIDIDGCDYFILESLRIYRPKVICIEYNPTIPNEVEFVQPKDFSIKQGSSAKAITRLAATKGYTLVATTYCNLILVRNEFRESVVGPDEVSLDLLRDDADCRTFLFVGYDGTILSNKSSLPMPWHKMELDLVSLQQLPGFLRRLPPDYNFIQKMALSVVLFFKFPRQFYKRISRSKA